MTRQEMIQLGLLDELAALVTDPTNAAIILTEIGHPKPHPQFTDPLAFWNEVCLQIQGGLLTTGNDLQPLVDDIARRYPSNTLFSQHQTPAVDVEVAEDQHTTEHQVTEQAPEQTDLQFVSILVQGWDNVQHLLNEARTGAQALGHPPEAVNLGFANAEGVLLDLANWSPEEATQLATLLRQHQAGTSTAVFTSPYRDYLLRLIVVGPDQAAFEIPDIRASTPVRDVVSGVVGEYYAEKGSFGRRIAQARHHDKTGKERSLDPNKTLHEEGIRDNDTIELGLETRAGPQPPTAPTISDESITLLAPNILRLSLELPQLVPVSHYLDCTIPLLRTLHECFTVLALAQRQRFDLLKLFTVLNKGQSSYDATSVALEEADIDYLRLLSCRYGSPASYDLLGIGRAIKDILFVLSKLFKEVIDLRNSVRGGNFEAQQQELDLAERRLTLAEKAVDLLAKTQKKDLQTKQKELIISCILRHIEAVTTRDPAAQLPAGSDPPSLTSAGTAEPSRTYKIVEEDNAEP